MNWQKIPAFLSTLGPIGYVTASGTVATLVTIPFVFWLQSVLPIPRHYIAAVGILCIICTFIVQKAVSYFDRHDDPSEIVLDEVIGCFITFWGIALTTQSVLIGFILFRALDIIKFGLVKKAEHLADAWGIMGDDIVAAIIANIVLRILFA